MNGADAYWLVAFVLAITAAVVALATRVAPGAAWLVPVLGWASVAFLALGTLILYG